MTFLYPWFTSTAKSNFEKYLMPFKGQPNLKFLEIGCFEGLATVWMLENVLTAPSSKIHVIDTFEGSSEHKELDLTNLLKTFKENIQNHAERVTIWKGFSQEVIRKFDPDIRFDFVYVDGSHMAADVLEDAILSFRLLKKGGIMIFDDYGWHKYEDELFNPGPGITAFIEMFDRELEILLKDYQVVIEKK